MAMRKIITRTYDTTLSTHVGRPGDIFYDPADGVLKVSNGTTPGGSSVERDPVFTAHVAYGITSTNITRWNAAWSYGDHRLASYAKQAVSVVRARYRLEERDETSTVIVEEGWYVDVLNGLVTAEVVEDGSTLGLTAGQAYLLVTLTGFSRLPLGVNYINALPTADGGSNGSAAVTMSQLTLLENTADVGYLNPVLNEDGTENILTAFNPAEHKFFYKLGTTTTAKDFYFQFLGVKVD